LQGTILYIFNESKKNVDYGYNIPLFAVILKIKNALGHTTRSEEAGYN